MSKPKFNQKRLENFLQKVFPNAEIKSFEKFSTGLVSPTFKVNLEKPSKLVVVKLGKIKNKNRIHQNNKILNYLNDNKIPAPKVFLDGVFDKKFITVMEYLHGDVASKAYERGNNLLRKNILFNAGMNLRKIHLLEIPLFWAHQRHEVENQREWKEWTRLRIDKYLFFFREKFSEYYDFIEEKLNEFWEILKNDEIDFVPLHWDYHLSNMNANKNGEITGIFDFDNAMKGHNLADIGQTAYWTRFNLFDYGNFESFLKRYKNRFTEKEMKLIKGYFLLHLLAVSRSVWFKQKRLGWIIDEHKLIIDEFKKGNI